MQNVGLDGWNQDCQKKCQQLQVCRQYSLKAENEEEIELKSFLMVVKEENKKQLKSQHPNYEDHDIWS